ncbi:MAG: RraA family protein [Gemmatimonadetes bacterium]|nr:RraA family protein [Gemmatimonadota bacterium]
MAQLGRIGFRIVTDPPRPEPALVARLYGIPSANLADAMGRFHFMDPGIRLRSGTGVCGVAVTVNARPGDNLMVHKALELARPGDVIVVCTNGDVASAVFGELMCRTAAGAGAGGIVVDGAVRDVEGMASLNFAAYSRTVSIGSCDKDGPGEINVPIACGGTVVMPGDIVVGDADGVAVVPRSDAEEVLALVTELVERERTRIEEIRAGALFKSDIDETLRRKGVLA